MNKVLLIFGSNGALGKGVTDVLLQKDYDKVYLFDFHPAEINNSKVEQIEVKDLSIEENVKNAFAHVIPSKSSSFFLFSTVGGFAGGKTIRKTETEEWDRMININLKTGFLIAKYFSILVEKSHSGSICFTSAYTGLNAEAGKAAYGASKAALIHLIKTIDLESKELNLTANAIAPYIIDTPANRSWMKDADYDTWIKPDEIGEFIHSVFSSYNFVSGNIFKLTHRFNKKII